MASVSRSRVVALGGMLQALLGCGAQGSEPGGERFEGVRSAVAQCDVATAGGGWVNHAIPESSGVFSASWRAYPSSAPIDSVMGFSNGAASRFTDLGPIVRFGPQGYVDLRDGADYVPTGYGYAGGVGPFEFLLRVDVPAHRYSAWVRHLDALAKDFEFLAQDLAFRTEQLAVPKVDNWGAFTDGTSGSAQSCSLRYAPPNGCLESKNDGVWLSRPFDYRLSPGYASVNLYARVDANVDAVIGVASGVPARFDQLAAIVRFRPDGRLDARNGGTYAADTEFVYAPNTYYQIWMALDFTRGTYDVNVASAAQPAQTARLAQSFAFRSEQAGLTDVDHVAQFIDGTPGSLTTCASDAL